MGKGVIALQHLCLKEQNLGMEEDIFLGKTMKRKNLNKHLIPYNTWDSE